MIRLHWTLLLIIAMQTSCTTQQRATVFDAGPTSIGCDGAPSVTLDDLWTRYLSPTPTSGLGGCAQGGCHGDGAGGFAFTTPTEFAAAAVNVPSLSQPSAMRIAPNDPAHSYALSRLTSAFDRMPPGGPFLDGNAIADWTGWICAGAPTATTVDAGAPPDGATGDHTAPVFAGAQSAVAGPSSATLAWTAATDDVTPSAQITYLVYQSTTPGGENLTTPTYVTPPGATSFAIGRLAVSTKYYFIVRARDLAGNVDGNAVEVSATTPSISDSQAPSFGGVTSANAAGLTVTLGWSAATDNVSASSQIVYLIYQATSSGGESYATPTYTTTAGASSFAVTGLTPNITYYFVVRAQDQAGNVSTNTQQVSAKIASVSFATQVEPIFMNSCTGAACHTGNSPAEGLNLSSAALAYGGLVNVLSAECKTTERVAPSSPSTSYLMWKLQGSGSCFFGSRMPKTGTLSASELATISGWIAEGAPNN